MTEPAPPAVAPAGPPAALAPDVDPAGAGPADGAGRDPGFLTLAEAAERHGAFAYVERRLFELTGTRSATAGLTPEVQVHLFEASAVHAWHAQLWSVRLPVLAGADHGALTRPAGPAVAAMLDLVSAADGEPALLAGLYRCVLPRLLASYRGHAAALTPAADGPALRALRLVRRDTRDQLAAGEPLVQRALVDEASHDAAVSAQRRIEALAVAAGIREGLFPW